ncbi:uncharacterized protein IWZ02DRAFT_455718 [Phyllosticta citriasiana]|uniref:uncharacterized protein n=1 Tax=Phyllosticta citriasiana TaxID=595635 RepID=UPI0030FD5393
MLLRHEWLLVCSTVSVGQKSRGRITLFSKSNQHQHLLQESETTICPPSPLSLSVSKISLHLRLNPPSQTTITSSTQSENPPTACMRSSHCSRFKPLKLPFLSEQFLRLTHS